MGIIAAVPLRGEDAPAARQTGRPIPFSELGASVGAQYQGDDLSVAPTPEGARLRCVFQKLEGQATAEGLWLNSTANGAKGDHFRVMAVSVTRSPDGAPLDQSEFTFTTFFPEEGIPENLFSRIDPLNSGAPEGQQDNSPGQANGESTALGTNAPNTLLPRLPLGEERAGERRVSNGSFMGRPFDHDDLGSMALEASQKQGWRRPV